ncbi:hypothetical protein GLOIN_2v1476533 [Rhizophagus irregularis DAOM 181602=DAOM 197198]|nr:hypothetical protein GLOIN_2v1476533 [Rhizophagus irregularis DAOM 181602=DAOM 197198]
MRKSHLSSTKPFSLREGANFSDAIFFQEIKSLVRAFFYCWAQNLVVREMFCFRAIIQVFFFQIRENLKVFWISLDALFGILIWDFGLGLGHWNETDTKTWTRLMRGGFFNEMIALGLQWFLFPSLLREAEVVSFSSRIRG